MEDGRRHELSTEVGVGGRRSVPLGAVDATKRPSPVRPEAEGDGRFGRRNLLTPGHGLPYYVDMTNEAATSALYDYSTAEYLRDATTDELVASVAAAEKDGGAGVIDVDGRSCYVAG